MKKVRTHLEDRVLPSYTKGEEIFNMVSHIAGGALAIAALVIGIMILMVLLQQAMSTDLNQITLRLIKS